MELTVTIHHEDLGYWAEVSGAEPAELQGVASTAVTLSELADCLEEGIQMVLDDPSFRLVDRQLQVGTVRLAATSDVLGQR